MIGEAAHGGEALAGFGKVRIAFKAYAAPARLISSIEECFLHFFTKIYITGCSGSLFLKEVSLCHLLNSVFSFNLKYNQRI